MLKLRRKASELELLIELMTEVVEGEPWHGKSVKAVLENVQHDIVFEKVANQHSILELIWHMANWKAFCLSRVVNDDKDLAHFEERDWRQLDHSDRNLWEEGVDYFWTLHHRLMKTIAEQDKKFLGRIVPGRKYNYRKLLNGIIQHDVYHSGQIAYINNLLSGK